MDFELSEDQRAFRDTAREFAQHEFAPHAAQWDAESIFPVEAIRRAGELGFCGLYALEECGGLGLPRLDASIVFEELAAACPSTTAYLTIHNMATWMVTRFARPEVAAEWGPRLTSGKLLASYCLTEPSTGADAASLTTRAVRDGDHYVLDGAKAFISGAGATDVLIVMARTDEAGPKGISAFLVPADNPHVEMGWSGQPAHSIAFDGVPVPASHLLGEEGEGFAMKDLDGSRINIAACSVGAAQGALDAALAYLQEHRQFGRPLADFQALQFEITNMATELVAARQMVRLAASKLDAGAADATMYCVMAKRLATDLEFSVCNQALQLHNCIRNYPLERLLRNAQVHQSQEAMRVVIARRMLSEHTTETPQ